MRGPRISRGGPIWTASRVIALVFTVVEVLLLVRFTLNFLGANADQPLTSAIYGVSGPSLRRSASSSRNPPVRRSSKSPRSCHRLLRPRCRPDRRARSRSHRQTRSIEPVMDYVEPTRPRNQLGEPATTTPEETIARLKEKVSKNHGGANRERDPGADL